MLKLRYIRLSKQRYGAAVMSQGLRDDINVCMTDDDSCIWEFKITEHDFSSVTRRPDTAIRVGLFADALVALGSPRVQKALGLMTEAKTLDDAERALKAAGFTESYYRNGYVDAAGAQP